MNAIKPKLDTHKGQADRVVPLLLAAPDSTAAEINALADCGCISKVLSAMEKKFGYVFKKGWRYIKTAGGTSRRVRTYAIAYRPEDLPQLF